jgi:hypothetical protein
MELRFTADELAFRDELRAFFHLPGDIRERMRLGHARVFTMMGLFLVNDLTPVDVVLQHQVERAARERLAASEATRSARPALALDPAASSSSFNKRTEPSSA